MSTVPAGRGEEGGQLAGAVGVRAPKQSLSWLEAKEEVTVIDLREASAQE